MKRRPGSRKAVTFTPQNVQWQFGLPGTNFNYAKEVGDGLKSSVIVPLLCWLMRAVPEPPIVVEQLTAEQWIINPQHKLPRLLRRPNPFYTRRALLQATVMDYSFGEAFWIKNRNGLGDVTEVYWAPRALMTPKLKIPGNIDTLYYEYRVNGIPKEYAPSEVVHFRFGADPANPLRGYSYLASMFREVYVDDQAANFTASILRNLGIIGLLFAPEGSVNIPPAQLPQLKDYVKENFTGDKRGNAMIFSTPMKAQVLQYNLQGFDVGPIRDISEERLSAAVGVPAAVVGFGTGLQQTKVGATMREMRLLAWRQAVIPMQEDFGEELDRSLLPDFQSNVNLFRVSFDFSAVADLWEDKKDQHDRIRQDLLAGVIKLSEARRDLGWDVQAEHEVYYRPITVEAVKKPTDPPQPAQVRASEQVNTPPVATVPGAPLPVTTGGKQVGLTETPHFTIINQMPDQPAPIVNVEPTPVTVETTAPIINVSPTPITVEPRITVQAPSAEAVRIERDAQGRPKRIVREG